jgi:prophage antirepressor-like protein
MGERVLFGANGQITPWLTGDDLAGAIDYQRPDVYDASDAADAWAKAMASLRSELRGH